MINSIQQFSEKGIINFEKAIEKFIRNPKSHADFIYDITDGVVQLGLNIIAETLEQLDQELRSSAYRRLKWSIVKRDQTTLLTSLGSLSYHKTLFINKETKERVYLLDRIMNLESHTRITEDAHARILEEAVESSYRKGGERASITEQVSKQTVKNKIHQLSFESLENPLPREKKKVRILHINADEDHVSAQFFLQKGDLSENNSQRKHNTFMPKIVYVYEDVLPENEDGTGKRHKLINPRYFGGLYEGKENGDLWKEVSQYIQTHYDSEVLEKVYLCGDGAAWIKSGCEWIEKSVFVLDRFHRNQCIRESISHMKDSQSDAWDRIMDSFSLENKKELSKVYKELAKCAQTEKKQEAIEGCRKYLLNHWEGIVVYNDYGHEIKGCSAEGHVSHVYSSRMSSRPLGWSRTGVDKMSRLRIYYYNNGKMLDLVRAGKEEIKKEDEIELYSYSATKAIANERSRHGELGKYVEAMTYQIQSPMVKKIACFKGHIWGL